MASGGFCRLFLFIFATDWKTLCTISKACYYYETSIEMYGLMDRLRLLWCCFTKSKINAPAKKKNPELQHVAVLGAMVEVVFKKTQYFLGIFLLCGIRGWCEGQWVVVTGGSSRVFQARLGDPGLVEGVLAQGRGGRMGSWKSLPTQTTVGDSVIFVGILEWEQQLLVALQLWGGLGEQPLFKSKVLRGTWENSLSSHLYQGLLGFTFMVTGAVSGALGCLKLHARSCQTPDLMIPAPKMSGSQTRCCKASPVSLPSGSQCP